MKAVGIDHRIFTSRIAWLLLCFVLLLSTASNAQPIRIYACAISNDSTGAFLGGSSRGSGLYASDDTGKTWRHLGWDNIKCYAVDIVQRTDGRILYMGTGLGVLKSTDYGEHWKQVTDWRVSEVLDVAINELDSNDVFIATAHGIWHTSDGGIQWMQSNRGLRSQFVSRIEFEENNKKDLVAATEAGAYESTNHGKSWKMAPCIMHPRARDINQGVNDWTVTTEGYGVDTWSKVHENTFDTWHELDTVWALGGFNLEDFTWAGPTGTIVHRRSYKGERSNLRNVSSVINAGLGYELAGCVDGGVFYKNWNGVNFTLRGLPHCHIWRLKLDYMYIDRWKQRWKK
jgi:hypothetical protein